MRLLESAIERWVCYEAMKRYSIPNVKLQKPGWPDRMFLIPGGRPLYIEFKRPGEEPRKLQLYVHSILKTLGYRVQVHDNKKEAIEAIGKALCSANKRRERRTTTVDT